MIFKINSVFQSAIYEDREVWSFKFGDKTTIVASEFWRILEANKIKLVSFDKGQQFGLPQLPSFVEEISKLLGGKVLIEIQVDINTADLTLVLSDNLKIEIFITSLGYETYEFWIDSKRYIGLGGGQLGLVEATNNPQIFTTKVL